MPTASTLPPVTIPDKDLFSFMFERDNKPYADDHGVATFPHTLALGFSVLISSLKLFSWTAVPNGN